MGDGRGWERAHAEVGSEFTQKFESHKLEPNYSLHIAMRSGVLRHLEHPLDFHRLTVRLAEGRCIPLKVKDFRKCCEVIVALGDDEIFDARLMFAGGGLYLQGCREGKRFPGWWTRWRDKVPSAD